LNLYTTISPPTGQQALFQPGGIISSVSSNDISAKHPHKADISLDAYTAATVLIAGYLCPTVLDEVTEMAITSSWNCALEILRKYQSYSTSARRCIAALEILYERVVSEGPPPHEPSAKHHLGGSTSNALNDMSLGEGMNAIFLDGFDWPDFQDMSWLNSVPSSLY
jgi:hypothetical protein